MNRAAALPDYQRALSHLRGGNPDLAIAILSSHESDVNCQSLLGTALFQSGRLAEARAAFTRVCSLSPRSADAFLNLGGVCQVSKDYPAARSAFETAVELRPHFHEALARLGAVCSALNLDSDAQRAFAASLACSHPSPYAYRQYGLWCRKKGHYDQAARIYDDGLARTPDDIALLLGAAETALARGEAHKAVVHAERAVLLDQASAHGLFLLGSACSMQGDLGRAEAALRRSLALDDSNAGCLYNLATVLKDQDRVEDARSMFENLLRAFPGHASAWNNLGVVREISGDDDGARHAYQAALAIDGAHANAHFNLGCLLAGLGELGAAWPHMEHRFSPQRGREQVQTPPPQIDRPYWQGQDLAGQAILIWPEQGYGDLIQFCRFAQMLKDRGARKVIAAARAPIVTLLAETRGVDLAVSVDAPLTNLDIDTWCWLMSLPRLVGIRTPIDIPQLLPYLSAPPAARERMRGWIEKLSRPRIGLVWKGNPEHQNDRHRSFPGVQAFAPVAKAIAASFVNLQYGDATNQIAGEVALHIPAPGISSFADAAAVIEQLDLVITVDTAFAHLAGALGKHVWVILPARGVDWRWLKARDDSPWYPGVMRLFRQERGETPAAVVDRIARSLILEFGPSPQRG